MFKKETILKATGLFLLVMTITSTASAQTLVQRNSGRMMQGARPLGMGNAFIATKGTDENAMFYNPAAINDYEKKLHFRFLLPTVEFSAKAINFFASDLPDLADDINNQATTAGKINQFDAFAAANTGRYEEVGVRGNAVIMMHKYLTASIFYESQAVLALTNPASSTVDIEAINQGGLMIGSAYSFFDDHLQVGAAVKFIERHLVDQTVTQRDIIVNASGNFGDIFNLKEFGFGIGFDIGVKGTPPIRGKVWEYLKPVFAITLQDIGDTRFFAGDNVGRQQQSLSFGYALHPDFWKLKSTFAMDLRDLDHRGDFLTKFHVGYELTWPEISKILRSVSVRVGVNQIYVTGGVGFDFKYFKMDLATYGREIGARTIQKQSRMFTASLSAGF